MVNKPRQNNPSTKTQAKSIKNKCKQFYAFIRKPPELFNALTGISGFVGYFVSKFFHGTTETLLFWIAVVLFSFGVHSEIVLRVRWRYNLFIVPAIAIILVVLYLLQSQDVNMPVDKSAPADTSLTIQNKTTDSTTIKEIRNAVTDGLKENLKKELIPPRIIDKHERPHIDIVAIDIRRKIGDPLGAKACIKNTIANSVAKNILYNVCTRISYLPKNMFLIYKENDIHYLEDISYNIERFLVLDGKDTLTQNLSNQIDATKAYFYLYGMIIYEDSFNLHYKDTLKICLYYDVKEQQFRGINNPQVIYGE